MRRWLLIGILFDAIAIMSYPAHAQTFWTGGVNMNWDAATFNWVSGSPLIGAAYSDGAAVQFGDTNPVTGGVVANVGGIATIAIRPAGVSPASIQFTNVGPTGSGVNYVIGGGPILGVTGLTVAGTDGLGGSVSLTSANSFSGLVAVQAGRLNLSDALAIGNSSGVTVAAGAALELQSSGATVVFGQTADASAPVPLSLSGPGISGEGALANLSGSNVYAGPITVDPGSSGATISSGANVPGNLLSLTGGISVAPGTILTLAGPGQTRISSGGLSLAATTVAGSSALHVTGPGTAEIDSPPMLGNGSSIAIAGGVLRFNLSTGPSVVGSGVTTRVSAGGTLELSGSVSALATGSSRVDIVNDSAAGGILVTGTGQQVGGIDGIGDLHIAAGGDLVANHVIQDALVIGGTGNSPALLTIASSDSSGNPLATTNSLISTNSMTAAAGSLVGSGRDATRPLSDNPFLSVAFAGSAAGGITSFGSAGGLSVPEPSGLALVASLVASLLAARVYWKHLDSSLSRRVAPRKT